MYELFPDELYNNIRCQKDQHIYWVEKLGFWLSATALDILNKMRGKRLFINSSITAEHLAFVSGEI